MAASVVVGHTIIADELLSDYTLIHDADPGSFDVNAFTGYSDNDAKLLLKSYVNDDTVVNLLFQELPKREIAGK